ncbi:MAG: BMP family ABC transporter substrate-binding protein, partial [Burkholderiales bacterium]
MFSPTKRSWLKAAAFAAVAVLAACGKEEPPPPKAVAPAADAKAPAPAGEPFKVAWMYVGPVGDAG